MAGFNGSGTYVRNYSWVNDKTNGINITSSRFDTEDNSFATGLSTCICKDGQTTTSAVIPFAQGITVTAGTANAPPLAFAGDNQTGFYNSGSGTTGYSSRGAQTLNFGTSGLTLLGSASGSATINVRSTAGSGINFTLPASNGSNGQLLQTDGSGNASWVTVGSGSGTVNSGTTGQLAYYASSTNAVSGNSNINVSGAALTVGVAGTSLGQIKLTGNTSGTIILTPPAVAGSGTITLPVATDTLVGKATTDTLTNKTYDTGGTGNIFKIAGTQISSISGNTSKVATTSGSLTSAHIAVFDASGNIVDGGAISTTPAAFAIGAYAMAWDGNAHTAGDTVLGSTLTIYGVTHSTSSLTSAYTATSDTAPSGTWRCMQTVATGNNAANVGLWLRIS